LICVTRENRYGCGGAAEDYDVALQLYARAAAQGLADAQYVAHGGHVTWHVF
jgi:hypothetical protein